MFIIVVEKINKYKGILEGQARPHWATLSAMLGTWLVGLTMSYTLAIAFDMKMKGLWLGIELKL